MNQSTFTSVSTFAQLYEKAMKSKSPPLTTYAIFKRLGHSSNGLVSEVLAGNNKVPLNDLDAWLDAVDVSGRERRELESQAIYEFGDQFSKRLFKELQDCRIKYESVIEMLKSRGIDLKF